MFYRRKQKFEIFCCCDFCFQSRNSTNKEFMCDKHLSDVLVFPAGTDLHDHPLYVSGQILLQDKVKKCLLILTHQESLIAQWLEHPTGIWEAMGSIPVGTEIFSLSCAHDIIMVISSYDF